MGLFAIFTRLKKFDNIINKLGAKKGVYILDFVLNFLFPPVCGICGKINENWLCTRCRDRLKNIEKSYYIYEKEKILKLFNIELKNVNIKLSRNKFCGRNEIYFDEFFYYFEYKSLTRKLLLKYKFSDASYLSNLFANVILNNKKTYEIFENYDIMFPVPMDKKKELNRGYNQTELITKIIEKYINKKTNINLKIDNNSLIKIKLTKTQSTLNAKERTQNIENAFKLKNNIVKNKRIIIFDDICTTGATVNEISRILKIAGAKKILVLVIAKD